MFNSLDAKEEYSVLLQEWIAKITAKRRQMCYGMPIADVECAGC